MKCPKCGYNSFEFYDNCKKCSNDLTGYKLTYSISPVVIPLEVKARLAAERNSAKPVDNSSNVVAENNADMFAFNESDDTSAVAVGAVANEDPFNFDETDTAVDKTGRTGSDVDPFADLLESTSLSDNNSFGGSPASGKPAATRPEVSAQGEYELDSFSWYEGAVAADSGSASKADEDDFDSFFGDIKETPVK